MRNDADARLSTPISTASCTPTLDGVIQCWGALRITLTAGAGRSGKVHERDTARVGWEDGT